MVLSEPEGTTRSSTSALTRKKGQSRYPEIAFLEKLSKSLDTYADNPLPPAPAPAPRRTKSKTSTAASEASKNAAKTFLAAKTLVKNIAKACAQEKFAVTGGQAEGSSNALLEALVKKYEGKYPGLTRNMLVHGLARCEAHDEDSAGDAGAEGDDAATEEVMLSRITALVDVEMKKYHDKIEALKKSRERAASEPEPVRYYASGRKRKATCDYPPEHRPKTAEETVLMGRIVAKYTEARSKHEYKLPNGALETIADESKKDLGMESFCMHPTWMLDVRRTYFRLIGKRDGDCPPPNKARDIFEDVYRRYSDAKKSHGGRLPSGTFASIIEDVQQECDMGEIKPINLKIRCQARFTKEHPEFNQTKYVGQLSEEESKRRQTLLNEIVRRYVRRREAAPKKVADGTLERVIRKTQKDLGMTDCAVNISTIKDRLRRRAYHVQTGGPTYDAVDAPLVATINAWLGQGMSVTREQGLDLAHLLRKGRQQQGEEKANGPPVVIDAKWWRKFLARNKHQLVRSLK